MDSEIGDVFGMLAMMGERNRRRDPEAEFKDAIKRLEREKKQKEYDNEAIISIDNLLYDRSDKSMKLVSDAFRKSKSYNVKHAILRVYEREAFFEEVPKKYREAICNDILSGLRDKDEEIRNQSIGVFIGCEKLTKGINRELGEKIVKELFVSSERGMKEYAVYALGNIDYSTVSKATKQRVLDFLVNEATEAAGDASKSVNWRVGKGAARSIDQIWNQDRKDKAAMDSMAKATEPWLPMLDSRKKNEVQMALNLFGYIECEAAADKIPQLMGKDLDHYFLSILEKSAARKHEDLLLKLLGKNTLQSKIEVMKEKGWEKSLEFLNGVVKNPKGISEYDTERAQDAIKEIRKRIGVSAKTKTAADKIEEAMETKEKRPVTLK